MPADELAAGAARRFLQAALAEWSSQGLPSSDGFEDRLVYDATLLISELVTNAVVHAGTTVEIVCRLDADSLVIEVADRHPGRVLRGSTEQPDDHREGGRGLYLVAALSDVWGVTYHRDHKTVWCSFEAAGERVPCPRTDPDQPLLAPTPPPDLPRRADIDWVGRGSLTFLAEASDLLAGQLDEDNVASLATQLLVPRLADWCAVWLYPAGAAPGSPGSGTAPSSCSTRCGPYWSASRPRPPPGPGCSRWPGRPSPRSPATSAAPWPYR